MTDMERAMTGLENLRDAILHDYIRETDQAVKTIDDALELLKEQQHKTGHWKRTGRKNVYGGIEIVCSVCDDHVIVQNVDDELFCRHCGAEMNETFNPVAET